MTIGMVCVARWAARAATDHPLPHRTTRRALAPRVAPRQRVVGDTVPRPHRMTSALNHDLLHGLPWGRSKRRASCATASVTGRRSQRRPARGAQLCARLPGPPRGPPPRPRARPGRRRYRHRAARPGPARLPGVYHLARGRGRLGPAPSRGLWRPTGPRRSAAARHTYAGRACLGLLRAAPPLAGLAGAHAVRCRRVSPPRSHAAAHHAGTTWCIEAAKAETHRDSPPQSMCSAQERNGVSYADSCFPTRCHPRAKHLNAQMIEL